MIDIYRILAFYSTESAAAGHINPLNMVETLSIITSDFIHAGEVDGIFIAS